MMMNGNTRKNEQRITVCDRLDLNDFYRWVFFCLGAAPVPFEKDDDFQIDFIAAATVSLFDQHRNDTRNLLV